MAKTVTLRWEASARWKKKKQPQEEERESERKRRNKRIFVKRRGRKGHLPTAENGSISAPRRMFRIAKKTSCIQKKGRKKDEVRRDCKKERAGRFR